MNGKILLFILIPLFLVGAIIFLNTNKSGSLPGGTSMTNDTPMPELTKENSTDEQRIKEALSEKNAWDPDEFRIEVTHNDGTYASGMVGPAEPGPGGGAWFAQNTDGNWEIVWDGNGSIECSVLDNYPQFPTDLIAECYDQDTGQIITR